MTVEIRGGGEEFAAISRRLKEAGATDLQRELSRAVVKALTPLKKELPKSALARLPSRGGLAEQIAKTRFRVRRSASVQRPGLRLEARNVYDLIRLDDGTLRHPVFADSSEARQSWTWVDQKVSPGWFTEPANAAAPKIRAEIRRAMQAVADKIDRGGVS